MINKVKTLAAAAALTALPMTAFAAPVLVNADVDLSQPNFSFDATVNAGQDGALFTFTVLEALRISGISVSGSGTAAGIQSTMFKVVNPDSGPSGFQSITTGFGAGSGSDVVAGQVYAENDVFSVEFTETTDTEISYTVSFVPSEVPVPAAGLLLLGALGGFAGLRRRKKA